MMELQMMMRLCVGLDQLGSRLPVRDEPVGGDGPKGESGGDRRHHPGLQGEDLYTG